MTRRYEFRNKKIKITYLDSKTSPLFFKFCSMAEVVIDHEENTILKNRFGNIGNAAYLEMFPSEGTYTLTAPAVFYDSKTGEQI